MPTSNSFTYYYTDIGFGRIQSCTIAAGYVGKITKYDDGRVDVVEKDATYYQVSGTYADQTHRGYLTEAYAMAALIKETKNRNAQRIKDAKSSIKKYEAELKIIKLKDSIKAKSEKIRAKANG